MLSQFLCDILFSGWATPSERTKSQKTFRPTYSESDHKKEKITKVTTNPIGATASSGMETEAMSAAIPRRLAWKRKPPPTTTTTTTTTTSASASSLPQHRCYRCQHRRPPRQRHRRCRHNIRPSRAEVSSQPKQKEWLVAMTPEQMSTTYKKAKEDGDDSRTPVATPPALYWHLVMPSARAALTRCCSL